METLRKVEANLRELRAVRVRKVNADGKGVIQNKASSIQRRRVQSMLFRLQAITDKKYKFPAFRMVNFCEGKRHQRKVSNTNGMASTFVKQGKQLDVLQVSLRCAYWTDKELFRTVSHELGHIWFNLGHDDNCKIMSAIRPDESKLLSIEESEKYFKMLSDKFQETLK